MKHSVYIVPCKCGEEVRMPEATGACPHCGRLLEVEREATT